ncbi:ribbon-helix-helix domain-containing protein [Fervidicoccus fontis]|uniref:Ribbon-helix-helix protein, CopG family n=1 Tax=Fervidicoccus fontis TaxID=683846 RepID=A0A7C2VA07_9CREN|nr:ribbon-helix-helix domain-containing protein [Fervidicoccus fontis]HEW63584.1 ribbon-helix-helix protein, CopG family [Fervidicoccus fontis]
MSKGKCVEEPISHEEVESQEEIAKIFVERLKKIVNETKGKIIGLNARCLTGVTDANVNSVFRYVFEALRECTNVVIDVKTSGHRKYTYVLSVERAKKLTEEDVNNALNCYWERKAKGKTESHKMPLISVHLPKDVVAQIDKLITRGIYASRAEFIRDAVRYHLLRFSCQST